MASKATTSAWSISSPHASTADQQSDEACEKSHQAGLQSQKPPTKPGINALVVKVLFLFSMFSEI